MSDATEVQKPVRARGRPRKGDSPVRLPRQLSASEKGAPKDEILKVAASLFSMKGYAGTTMAEIADVVGIRSPSLYYHFSDKSEILRAIANMCLDDALSGTKKQLKNKNEPISKRLYTSVYDLVHHLCDSPYELNCMFDPAFHGEEFAEVNKRLQSWLGGMETLIRRGIESGHFSPQNTKVAAYSVRGLVESAIRQLGGFSKLSSQETADYVATFAVKGLIANQSYLKDIK